MRVREWLPDDPYPRAMVEPWPDARAADPGELAGAYAEQVATLRRILAMAVELGVEASPMVELDEDPAVGSYQIGVLAPLGPLDRQRLLTAAGPAERLILLEEMLADQEVMLAARLADG